MGSFRRQFYDELGEEYQKHYGKHSGDENYKAAYKKVKKIKGFYSHLKVYIIVNLIIIFSSLNRDFFGKAFNESGLFEWHTYSTAVFWGIAILIHAFTVFGPDVFFSKDWEQKKIQKYIDKDAQNKNKWE